MPKPTPVALSLSLLVAVHGCFDPARPPVAASVEEPKGSETAIAGAGTRATVDGYGASIAIPERWSYTRPTHAVGAQSPSKRAGLVLFGARDLEEVKTLLAKLRDWMKLDTHDPEGESDAVVIHGTRFVRVQYPKATLGGAAAVATVAIARVGDGFFLTLVTYELDSEEQAERAKLQAAIESVVVE